MHITYWNAGDAGCGSLILGLKRQINAIPPGGLLEVTAESRGAAIDIPAWCRLARLELVDARHPVYVLKKQDEASQTK